MCMCVHALGSRSGLGRNRPVVRLLLLSLQGPGDWGEPIRPRFMPLSVCVCVCACHHTKFNSQLVQRTSTVVKFYNTASLWTLLVLQRRKEELKNTNGILKSEQSSVIILSQKWKGVHTVDVLVFLFCGLCSSDGRTKLNSKFKHERTTTHTPIPDYTNQQVKEW